MRPSLIPFAVLLVALLIPAQLSSTPLAGKGQDPQARRSRPKPVADSLEVVRNGALQLGFEENRGQLPAGVQFFARQKNLSVFLTGAETVMALEGAAARVGSKSGAVQHKSAGNTVRMQLVNGRRTQRPLTSGKMPAVKNYYLGKDPAKWFTGVPSFSKVRYRGVYPGVDLLYYMKRGKVEYDFIVGAGADPAKIVMSFEGARRITVDRRGDLVLHLAKGKIRQSKPFAYQKVDGVKKEVPSRYLVDEEMRVRFGLGRYDRSKPLVIDPVITYGTYLGGSGDDVARAVEVDGSGSPYITGSTTSPDFPTQNRSQAAPAGKTEVFVAKLNPQGSGLVYATYIGGAEDDAANAISVDAGGNAYVAGVTRSDNFPGTGRAGSADAFVVKLKPSGALDWSRQLGGPQADEAHGVAAAPAGGSADPGGGAYVTGSTLSPDFPGTENSHDSTCGTDGKCNERPDVCIDGRNEICVPGPGPMVYTSDAFVSKLGDGGTLDKSTFLGGAGDDAGKAVAVDAAANPYVTGYGTITPTGGAYDSEGGQKAFAVKLEPLLSGQSYATYLGFSSEHCVEPHPPPAAFRGGQDIAVDASGRAYITGSTFIDSHKIFVVGLDPPGERAIVSTSIGRSMCNLPSGIGIDQSGNIYVGGSTSSIHQKNPGDDFPTKDPIEPSSAPGGRERFDAFVMKLAPDGGLSYSTTLGGAHHDGVEIQNRAVWSYVGLAVDSAGNAYLTGPTSSNDFPWTDAAQREIAGGADAFLLKIAPGSMPAPAVASVEPRGGSTAGGTEVTITGTGFAGATSVRFGSAPSPGFSVSAGGTQITAVAPAHAEGMVAVTVQTPAGVSLGYYPPAGFHYGEGSWERVGELALPRYGHSATLLDGPPCRQNPPPDWCGKVLVAGGMVDSFHGVDGAQPDRIKQTELYDPRSKTWSSASCPPGGVSSSCPAPMHLEHFTHGAALMPDSRVLVVGGPAKAEIYNPAEGTWKMAAPPLGPEASQRVEAENEVILDENVQVPIAGGYAPILTTLPEGPVDFCGIHCGKVLLAGGGEYPAGYPHTFQGAQVYDPKKDEWTLVGPLNESRFFHRALLLTAGERSVLGPCGKVMILGGRTGTKGNHHHKDASPLESFDPATGVWTKKALWKTPRFFSSFNVTGDGKLLVAGGLPEPHAFVNGNGIDFPAYTGSAEIYDPKLDAWSPGRGLKTARYGHASVTLPDGKVLVVGGTQGGPLSSAEIYDPAAGIWKWAGSTIAARTGQDLSGQAVPAGIGPTATLLSDGTVLIVGGSDEKFAEIYIPANVKPPAPAFAAPCAPPARQPNEDKVDDTPPGGSQPVAQQTSTGGGGTTAASSVASPAGPGSFGSADPLLGGAASPLGAPPLTPGTTPALSSSPTTGPALSPGSAVSSAPSAASAGSGAGAFSQAAVAATHQDDGEAAPAFHMVAAGPQAGTYLTGALLLMMGCMLSVRGSSLWVADRESRRKHRPRAETDSEPCPALAGRL